MTDDMTDDVARDAFELVLRLLDHQVVDPDGELVCKVDDLELRETADGTYVVTALLAGPLALGPRLPGRLGRWVVALARRWSADADPVPRRIPFERVTDLGSAVVVDRSRDDLDVTPLEDWVRNHVVDRIPGSSHAGE
jgi:sporulation protein YlmC with PRC-barrel domain